MWPNLLWNKQFCMQILSAEILKKNQATWGLGHESTCFKKRSKPNKTKTALLFPTLSCANGL